MSTRNLAIVGLRLLAVYCFVEAISLFTTLGVMRWISDPGILGISASSAFLLSFLPGASLLLLAVLLFVFSAPIAQRLTPPESSALAETACTFEQLQAIAFAVAGIMILAPVLPNVGRAVEGLVSLYKSQQAGGIIDARDLRESWLYAIGLIGQVIVGLVLLLNPGGCRKAWNWLRTAGT